MLLASCDSPEKSAMRQLSRAGIQPSGRALVEAVSADDQRTLDWLLAVKVHTEQRDERGFTPLRIAVENESPLTVIKLLEANADPNSSNPDGVDILGAAIAIGDSPMVEKLIEAGASPAGSMPDGEKILPWCIRNGRLAFVRSMLKAGADPHTADAEGVSLLHIAINSGHQDLVTTLIEEGADPGAIDPAGRGTLALALKNGWKGILPTLAAAGADPNLPTRDGRTLLEKAISEKDIEFIPQLMAIGADPLCHPGSPDGLTPLETAIASGDPAVLRAILRPGEMLDGPEWEPALRLAFHTDNLALARMLLKKGTREKRPGSSGLFLTEIATLSKKTGWLDLLLDYGHEPGKSVFYAACTSDHLTTKYLLKRGAKADFTLVPGMETALSVALRAGNDRLAALLLRHGAKANLFLPEKQKPLHFAIVTKNPETVRELLAAGADPNAPAVRPVSRDFLDHVPSKDMKWYLQRDRNITPLMLAANSGELASAKHLLDAGAKKNTYTRVNYTWPINFASRRSDVPMMRLLLGQNPETTERHIILTLSEQRARVYDATGKEIYSTKVSSGKRGYRTRQGEFVITDKHRHHTSSIYNSSMPYFQRLSCSDFGFHYGYVPGYPASHGCIRVPMASAKKLFYMTQVGDRVTIKP
ncbi:MAG: ankyrin repeat domain-containing protein [Luteolibacter sp.]